MIDFTKIAVRWGTVDRAEVKGRALIAVVSVVAGGGADSHVDKL